MRPEVADIHLAGAASGRPLVPRRLLLSHLQDAGAGGVAHVLAMLEPKWLRIIHIVRTPNFNSWPAIVRSLPQ